LEGGETTILTTAGAAPEEKPAKDYETQSFLITLTANLCAFSTVFIAFSWIRKKRGDKLVGQKEKKEEKQFWKNLKE